MAPPVWRKAAVATRVTTTPAVATAGERGGGGDRRPSALTTEREGRGTAAPARKQAEKEEKGPTNWVSAEGELAENGVRVGRRQ